MAGGLPEAGALPPAPAGFCVTPAAKAHGTCRGGLPEAGALLRELADFCVTLAAKANETFGAGSRGAHDDLVLAVALAVWDRSGWSEVISAADLPARVPAAGRRRGPFPEHCERGG